MAFEPAVKWSGSKRSQAAEIVARMPREIETYYEPFCGGCSVLRRLLSTRSVKCRRYVCSDLNADLINLWKEIKTDPLRLSLGYAALWTLLNKDGDLDRKKEFFSEIRARYNDSRSPVDFLFIMRTTTNGMPRYNAEGDFNNSFHVTRNGIEPARLTKILDEWSGLLKAHDVNFMAQSYNQIKPNVGDFIYLDPPYAATKGMYFGGFDTPAFFSWLGALDGAVRWLLSYDGKAGGEDFTYAVPSGLYVSHEYISNGNSSFRRVIGTDRTCTVQESLYANYRITRESTMQMEFFSC